MLLRFDSSLKHEHHQNSKCLGGVGGAVGVGEERGGEGWAGVEDEGGLGHDGHCRRVCCLASSPPLSRSF